MSGLGGHSRRVPSEGLSKEELEIRLRQCQNDLRVTREEARENSVKYMELLSELGSRNEELQSLKEGLEEVLKARNAELLIANESLRAEGSGEEASGEGREAARRPSMLRDVLGAAFAGMAAGAKARGVELRCGICAPAPERLEADADIVSQLLRSLAVRLLACCGSGSSLTVLASSEGDGALFELRLDGAGVEEERLEELRRLYAPGQEEPSADLLLAEALGGALSAPKGLRGLSFKIAPGQEWVYDGRPSKGRPLKILLAESSSYRRAALHHLFRKGGHCCVSVCDGRAALAEWKRAKEEEAPFDLLALSSGLCGLDARGVAMEIRRREESMPSRGRRTPVLAFFESQDKPPEGLSGPFDGAASMPMGKLRLERALESLCGNS